MFRKMVGLAFLVAGLAAIAASSICGSRASCAGDAVLRSPSALQVRLLQQPRSHGGTESEAHGQRKSRPPTPPEVNLAKVLDGPKDNEHFKDSEELAAMQAKVEQSWEADKLAKRQARTPEVAVQSAFSTLQSHKAAMAKSQTKITEWEAAAKQAAQLRRPSKRPRKLQGEVDKPQTEYDEEAARCVKPSDPVTHLQNTVREAFQVLSGNLDAQPLISQLETSFTLLSSLFATPTPVATAVRDDIDLQQDEEKAISNEALRAFTGRLARGGARGQEGKGCGIRRAREARLAITSATSTQSSVLAACKRPQARDQALNQSPRFWLEKDSQFVIPIRKHPGQLPLPTSQHGNLDS